jgi:DNA-binding MarR family transcriptional regulator
MNNFSRNKDYPTAIPPETVPRWDFLTSHAHVLLCISRDSGIRLRDIAAAVGITERSAHKVLSELVDEGYVVRERRGRRNHYGVKPEQALRHPLVREREVGELLKALLGADGPAQEAEMGATMGPTSGQKR